MRAQLSVSLKREKCETHQSGMGRSGSMGYIIAGRSTVVPSQHRTFALASVPTSALSQCIGVAGNGRVWCADGGHRHAAASATPDQGNLVAFRVTPRIIIRLDRARVFRRGVCCVAHTQTNHIHDMLAGRTRDVTRSMTGFSWLIRWYKLCQRDIGRAPLRSGAGWRKNSVVSTPGSRMCRVEDRALAGVGLNRMGEVRSGGRPWLLILSPTRFEQDTALLTAIGRRGGKAAGRRGQPPLLDIGFNEDKAGLAKVDMYNAGTIGADGWEEVGGLETVDHVLHSLSVPGKKDGSSPGSVSNTHNIALDERGTVRGAVKWLIETAGSGRRVSGRVSVVA